MSLAYATSDFMRGIHRAMLMTAQMSLVRPSDGLSRFHDASIVNLPCNVYLLARVEFGLSVKLRPI